jgi:malonyl-CoA O-methyltransferase
MLLRARGLGAVARGDLRALPVAAGSVEIVTCGLAVGHVTELGQAIGEMARALAPGGTLVYSDFHPAARQEGRGRTFSHRGELFEVEHHLHLPEAHRAACAAAGLEIDEMRDGLSGTEPPFPAVLAIRARRRR